MMNVREQIRVNGLLKSLMQDLRDESDKTFYPAVDICSPAVNRIPIEGEEKCFRLEAQTAIPAPGKKKKRNKTHAHAEPSTRASEGDWFSHTLLSHYLKLQQDCILINKKITETKSYHQKYVNQKNNI